MKKKAKDQNSTNTQMSYDTGLAPVFVYELEYFKNN